SRAEAVRANSAFFDQYQQEKAKQFLHFVLNRYEQTGVTELARERLPALIELSGLGTTKDASMAFGGKPAQLLAAFKQLQHLLYPVSCPTDRNLAPNPLHRQIRAWRMDKVATLSGENGPGKPRILQSGFYHRLAGRDHGNLKVVCF